MVYTDSSSIESESEKSPIKTKKYRKRQINKNNWKINVTKKLVNSGKEHITRSGNLILAKEINYLKLCNNNCTFKCTLNFSKFDITKIHELYYSLSRKDKLGYLINYSERIKCNNTKINNFSFRYYFPKNDSEKIRVCKFFFLNCLCISQKMIYNVHSNKNSISQTSPDENRGKKNVDKISPDCKNFVYNHIASYPTIQSHYCRKDSQKNYLDSNLK